MDAKRATLNIFFYFRFLSRTLMIQRTAGEGRGPSVFISITYTHSLVFLHFLSLLDLGCAPCFLIKVHEITRLLLDAIYPSLGIAI